MKSRTKLQTAICILLMGLVACVEVRDPKKQKDPSQGLRADHQYQVHVTPLSQPQKYKVHIKGVPPRAHVTRRSLSLVNPVGPRNDLSSGGEFEDIVDQEGPVQYVFQTFQESKVIEVQIPKDFVIEGDVDLSKLELNVQRENDEFRILETTGRVYFKAASYLTTQGENFLIRARSIESEGAVVQTFKPDIKAANRQPGRHGGRIKIEAEEIRGTLHFIIRGEAGGDGDNQWNQPDPKVFVNTGSRGGNSGLLIIQVPDQERGQFTYDLLPGEGGRGTNYVSSSFCILENCPPPIRTELVPLGSNGRKGISEWPVGLRKGE